MDKNVTLVIPGADETAEAFNTQLQPKATVEDLLREARKDPREWRIFLTRDGNELTLSTQDDLYAAVKDGEMVYASPAKMVVG